MKKNLTELVFIIDRSGSMSGFEKDTVGGFNSTIEEQRRGDGDVYVSTVLFDNFSEVLYDRVSIKEIKPMTINDYRTRGCTALFDAIGGAIKHIGNIHKYARFEDVPEKTVFMITTDGMENASRQYTRKRIKEMIKHRQEKYGWEFIFLAANIDAEEAADEIGIRRDRAVNYCQDADGVKITYDAMCRAITTVRSNKSLDDSDWRRDADKDVKRRRN